MSHLESLRAFRETLLQLIDDVRLKIKESSSTCAPEVAGLREQALITLAARHRAAGGYIINHPGERT